MWNLSSLDVLRAKEQAQRRRAELEARYAEERKVIDAECAAIESFERVAAEFAQRHNMTEAAAETAPGPAAEPAEEPPAERPEELASANETTERKASSRWRFQLAHREGAETPA